MIGTRYLALALAAAACIATASIANTGAPLGRKQAQLRGLGVRAEAPVERNVSRMIVKFRDGAIAPASRPVAHAARARELGAATGIGMDHLREMAGGASLLALKSPLPLSAARAAAARLAGDPTVEYAVPDIMMKRMAVPTDPQFLAWQWNLFAPTTTYNGSKIGTGAQKSTMATGGANLPPAWDYAPNASSVVVAIIDTGIVNHPDLNGVSAPAPYVPGGRFLAGYDFISSDVGASDGLPTNFVANDGDGRDPDPTDPGDWVTTAEEAQYPSVCDDGVAGPQDSSWHGTHMAGLVGAATSNGTGIAGVAWNVKILPLRALGKCGGSLSDIAEAIRWAAGEDVPGVPHNSTPAQVISLSLGGGDCKVDQYMQEAVNAAMAKGAVVVAATGNDGTVGQVVAPANCTGAIGVTAHTINGENADYANVGAGSAISAPGGGSPSVLGAGGSTDDSNWTGYYLWSTLLYGATDPNSTDAQGKSGPGYGGFTGTSPATPQVAGVAALIKSLRPAATPDFVKAWVTMASNVRPHPAAGICETYGLDCGRGLLDAGQALQAAQDLVPAVSVSTANRVVAAGASVSITGLVTPYPGRTILNSAWSASGGTLSGTTGSSVTLTVPATGSVTVTLSATDSAGKSAFDAIKIRVNGPPVINPIPNQTATVGQTVSFTVTATDPDNDPVSFSASALPPGALLTPAGQFSWNTMGMSPGTYQLVYQASDGISSTQGTVTMTLLPGSGPPVILTPPLSVTVTEGQTATFSVQVTGAAPLSYQWRRNGTPIGGATSFTYTTSPTVASDNGAQFSVAVSNSSGASTSSSATLTVLSGGSPPPVGGGGGGGGALPLGQLLVLAALLLAARIHRRE